MDHKNIVWLASYPKSGNTWFRIFLHNIFEDSQQPVKINNLHHTSISSDREMFDQHAGTNSSDLTRDEIREIRPIIYRKVAQKASQLIYVKVHDAWELNSSNVPIFPDDVTKGVIYLIRNPLEISVSFAHHNNISINESIAQINDESFGFCINPTKLYYQLQQRLLSWSEHVLSWTERSKLPVHIIRYEDMLQSPQRAFSSALDFINISFSKERIQRAINHSKFELLKSQEMANGFREKTMKAKSFFREGKKETWKQLLSKQDRENIISKNQYVMQKFGYTF